MKSNSRQERVERFRSAYNANTEVEIIPSNKDLGITQEDREELVGPYCRVSTLAETQAESYELQKSYYEEYVQKYPNWTLVDIYADEGTSATSMNHRKDFLRLIQDAKDGKVTKIITKQVNRFARNVVDCIATVRMLRALPIPVGVYFETECIDSLSRESDSQLSLLASFAESESINKSTSMKWAIRGRFTKGIPRIQPLYGYDKMKDENGRTTLTVISTEAAVVQFIFETYASGTRVSTIAEMLYHMHAPSPSGNERWSSSSILYILSNERYCGDICMQKTVCIDVFSHKSVKNDGIERRYFIKDNHDAIISRELWEKAQLQAKMRNPSIQDFIELGQVHQSIFGTEFFLVDAKKGNDYEWTGI